VELSVSGEPPPRAQARSADGSAGGEKTLVGRRSAVGRPRLEQLTLFARLNPGRGDRIWRSKSGAGLGGVGPLIHDRRTAIAYLFA
jgi:hypothetical protein